MKNKYVPTAAGLYLNYMLHGMGVLLITLNMAHLQQQWSTDAAGVSIVISSLGIGKLATLLMASSLIALVVNRLFISAFSVICCF